MTLLDILNSPDARMLASGVVIYHLLLQLVHRSLLFALPSFYRPLLLRLGTRKTMTLLVFLLGVTISIVSSPACAHAYLASPSPSSPFVGHRHQPDDDNNNNHNSPAGKVCLGARAVMWTAELPLLGSTHLYLVHHVLALTALFIFKHTSLSVHPLYLVYAGLVTEVLSSTRAFIRGSALDRRHPVLVRRLAVANALSVLLLRALPAAILLLQLLLGDRRAALSTRLGLAHFFGFLLYTGFVLYNAFRLLANHGFISLRLARPVTIILGGNGVAGSPGKQLTAYSLCLGLAIAAAQLASAVTYELASDKPLGQTEKLSLAVAGLGAAVFGLMGAKLMNTALSLATIEPAAVPVEKKADATENDSSPPAAAAAAAAVAAVAACADPKRWFPWFRGLSIQGAILFSTLWIALGPSLLGLPVNKRNLIGAVGVSLPLGEAIGRLGCCLSGCCGSTRKDKYPNIQLLATLLNMAIFVERCVFLARNGTAGAVCEAGAVAAIENAAVRLVLNPLRSDTAEKMLTPASVFSAAQLLLFSALMVLEKSTRVVMGDAATAAAGLMASCTAVAGVTCNSVAICRQATLAWEFAARHVEKRRLLVSRLASAANLVYALAALTLILVVSSSGDEKEESQRAEKMPLLLMAQKKSLVLLTDPVLWGAVSLSGILPVILIN